MFQATHRKVVSSVHTRVMRLSLRGACKVAKTTDTPFFMIGTALEAGKGLVPVNLSFAYISSGGGGGIQSIVAGNDITVDNTDPLNPIVATSGGIDGGFADSIYLIDQIIDGGNA